MKNFRQKPTGHNISFGAKAGVLLALIVAVLIIPVCSRLDQKKKAANLEKEAEAKRHTLRLESRQQYEEYNHMRAIRKIEAQRSAREYYLINIGYLRHLDVNVVAIYKEWYNSLDPIAREAEDKLVAQRKLENERRWQNESDARKRQWNEEDRRLAAKNAGNCGIDPKFLSRIEASIAECWDFWQSIYHAVDRMTSSEFAKLTLDNPESAKFFADLYRAEHPEAARMRDDGDISLAHRWFEKRVHFGFGTEANPLPRNPISRPIDNPLLYAQNQR